MSKPFPSKYKGKCATCGGTFDAGDPIKFASGKVVACKHCDQDCKPREQSEVVALKVRLGRIRFAAPDSTFAIAGNSEPVGELPEAAPRTLGFTVKGPLGDVRQGDVLSVTGRFVEDPKWGWELVCSTACHDFGGTDEGLLGFLRGLPEIGPRRAGKLLRHFGSRKAVLDVVANEPERLAELPGITAEGAQKVAQAFAAKADKQDILMFLGALELTDNLIQRILEHWGDDTQRILEEDPYQLIELPRVGFKKADEVARKMKIQDNDPRRVAAATLFLLKQHVDGEGHTWTTEADLMRERRW
jgi:exodeoxyribonuclease V alpha subunit